MRSVIDTFQNLGVLVLGGIRNVLVVQCVGVWEHEGKTHKKYVLCIVCDILGLKILWVISKQFLDHSIIKK